MNAKIGATRLGFGCASIPGPLTMRDALTVLETAFSCGIRHFDTARMYGSGNAERVLGELVREHGAELTIVTKAGIAAPNRFTRALGRASPLLANLVGSQSGRFAPHQIRQSVEKSLTELKLDRIDLLQLHEIRAHEVTDELKAALVTLRDEGKIAQWGLATSLDDTATISAAHPELCDVIQVPVGWLDQQHSIPANTRVIVHSVLGARLSIFTTRLRATPELARRFKEETGLTASNMPEIARLMLQAAMARNPHGVTLFGSTQAEHIRMNAAALTAKAHRSSIEALERAMRQAESASRVTS